MVQINHITFNFKPEKRIFGLEIEWFNSLMYDKRGENMKKLAIIAIPMAVFLSGCLDNKQRMNPVGPVITSPTTSIPVDGGLTKDDLASQTASILKQSADSQTAIQQNMQSAVGLSVGKLADDLVKVQAQVDSLVKLNATMNNNLNTSMGDVSGKIEASIASNNDIKLMMKNQMEFNGQLVASLKVNANLDAKLEALGAAQAGINNKIDQQTSELKQKMEAGRDVNNTNTQFTKEMLETIKSLNQTSVDTSKQWAYVLAGLISAIAGVCGTYLHLQKNKAEKQAQIATDRQFELHKKSIGILPHSDVTSNLIS